MTAAGKTIKEKARMNFKLIAKELLTNFSLEQVQVVFSLLPTNVRRELVNLIWAEYHKLSSVGAR